MQFIFICLASIIACVYAQVSMPPGYADKYPKFYKLSRQVRHPRDISWDRQIGNGKVFGTLGSNDDGLFGKGGYEKQFFDDNRGKLSGQAYGSRVLGPYGDSSRFGGTLDWSNSDAKAALDVAKEIGGRTRLTATGSGLWNLDKNTRLSAGGQVTQDFGHGRPDVGLQAQIQHDW